MDVGVPGAGVGWKEWLGRVSSRLCGLIAYARLAPYLWHEVPCFRNSTLLAVCPHI